MSNNSNNIITTPKVVALWPKLIEPNRKFNEDGDYEITVVLDPNNREHSNFIHHMEMMYRDAIHRMSEEHKKPKIKTADSPVRPVVDKEGVETGQLKCKFKLGASGQTKDGQKYERKPKLFDSGGEPYVGPIGHNAEVKVAFRASPYYVPSVGAGLSLRLEAVQVFSGGSAGRSFEEYGFSKSESSAPKTESVEDPEF